jgi:predicted HAD superfamily Cof-like phosphohydrolase
VRIGQRQVQEFHEAMGLTVGKTPAIREPELRARLLLEECFETVEALLGSFGAADLIEDMFEKWAAEDPKFVDEREQPRPSLPDVADGIADLIYVAYGTAVACGIDLERIEEAVHRTNMAKKDGPIDETGKKRKPPGWTPPDVAGLLREQGWKP